jgi:hypothetical protein
LDDGDVDHVIAVPIVEQQAPWALHRRGEPGGGGDVLKVKAAEVAPHVEGASIRRGGEEVEFSGEIEVGEGAIRGGERGEFGERADVGDLAVGRHLEELCAGVAEHDDILSAVVVEIGDEAAVEGVGSARIEGITERSEGAVGEPEQAEAAPGLGEE